MIKRRFYKLEHKQKDGGPESDSGSSSSSSDSEVEAHSAEDSEPEAVGSHEREEGVDDDEEEPEVAHRKSKARAPRSPSSSSGYESEESSGDEIPADSSDSEKDGKQVSRDKSSNGEMETGDKDGSIRDDAAKHVLVCKSVYKCKICPRIVCLNEESLKTHLQSKRHARSEKLLSSGRLKRMLNGDGEEVLEEEGETHAERHARILALAKASDEKETRKKRQGRQRQRQRMKKKQQANSRVIEAGRKSVKRKRQGPN